MGDHDLGSSYQCYCLFPLSVLQGIVNTFTEHWGGVWSVKDMQHTYVTSPFVLLSNLMHMSACWEFFGGRAVH